MAWVLPAVDGLAWASDVTVSPDGKHVYAAAANDNAISVFSRNSSDGKLTYVEVKKDGSGGADGLENATSVTVSPDGKHVYAAGSYEDAISVFSRNSSDGKLTYVEVKKDGVGTPAVDGLDYANSVTVSPDGKHVYVAGLDDNALSVFSRNSLDGKLTYMGVKKDGTGGVDGLNEAREVTVSPDGKHVYAIGGGDDAISVFSRGKNFVYQGRTNHFGALLEEGV